MFISRLSYNPRPARGRKPLKFELDYEALLLLQPTPRQGTETRRENERTERSNVTTRAPLGDGNFYNDTVSTLCYRYNPRPVRGRKLSRRKL